MESINQLLAIFLNFLLSLLGLILTIFALWLGKLAYSRLCFKKYLKEKLNTPDYLLLQIKLPLGSEKNEKAMESVLNGIHALLHPSDKIIDFGVKKFLSLEIVSQEAHIYFYFVVPKEFSSAIEGQIYAGYPEAEIYEVGDYTNALDKLNCDFAELKLAKTEVYPIKTYSQFETDPFLKIAGVLSKVKSDEQVWIQIVLYPENSKWWLRGWLTIRYILFGQKTIDKATQEKFSTPCFRGKIRLVYLAKETIEAKSKLTNLLSTFKQFKGVNELNNPFSFFLRKNTFLDEYQTRVFTGGSLFSTKELATLFHLPYGKKAVSHVVRIISKKAEPPYNLPKEGSVSEKDLSLFAETTFRGEKIKFGIKRDDRRRHLYIVGKTGVGKSKLLELLMISDLKFGCGLALLDPHGDLAEEVLKFVPKERIEDVVYFNPTDRDFPFAFNPLETTYDTEEKHIITTGFIAIFKKLFWQEWTPRMEQIIRHTVLALLESPNSCILGINRLLTEKTYRQKVVQNIQDPVVKSFWTQEFMTWNERFTNEAIVPLLNKIGQFISNPVIRNTIGQVKNVLDLEEILNTNKILIVNLAKGQLGEENSALLGSMIITKIQQAALARVRIPEEERRDFYLYVDEFQHFATSAFVTILSEARKYRLNLTIAHQYIAQLSPELQSTVFGNVGSLITFRVGGEDAAILSREFTPAFSTNDMLNLSVRDFYIKMSIDGQSTPPFSGRTIDIPFPLQDNSQSVKETSRKKYSRPRVMVENEINQWLKGIEKVSQEKFPEPPV